MFRAINPKASAGYTQSFLCLSLTVVTQAWGLQWKYVLFPIPPKDTTGRKAALVGHLLHPLPAWNEYSLNNRLE